MCFLKVLFIAFFIILVRASSIEAVAENINEKKADKTCFTHPLFEDSLAKQMARSIMEKNIDQLKTLIANSAKEELSAALKAQDIHKGVNLLAYAAHLNNPEAVKLISASLNIDFLKEILLQKDKHGWTPLHHLALMEDDGCCYKNLENASGIDTKKISDFFSESPWMLRKYVQPRASKFSTLHSIKPIKLYYRDGNEEQYLSFEELIKQHGQHFNCLPESFKLIPQVEPDFFRSLWVAMKERIERDEIKLKQLDEHLKKVIKSGEDGVFLAPITFNDRNEKLPDHIKTGLGIRARRDFYCDDIVTLYAGEYFFADEMNKSRSTDYAYAINEKILVDGLKFRSYGSTALHSAPNVQFWQIESMLGINFVAMCAIDEIKAGDQICENYGEDYFKKRKIIPLETRPEALKKMENNPKRHAQQTSYLKFLAQ